MPKLGTDSSLELGSAPVKEAIKILVTTTPRGIITASRIGKYCSPLPEFARSKTSDKNVNIEFEASLQARKKLSMLAPFKIGECT